MHYTALRPEEALSLRDYDITLPSPKDTGAWEELRFATAAAFAGREWTDSGKLREEHSLKRHADGHYRTIPLVTVLRAHPGAPYGKATDGRLFTGVRGGELPDITYRRVWTRVRSKAEHSSPLARRVYDLCHTCVSTWRNAGARATQVAARAGCSVEGLLMIFAKRRISDVLREECPGRTKAASPQVRGCFREARPRILRIRLARLSLYCLRQQDRIVEVGSGAWSFSRVRGAVLF